MATSISTITGLQNLPNLQRFDASDNYLESVDFSGLTNLTRITIEDCNIPNTEGENSLTSINVTGCTALVHLNANDADFSAGFPDLSDCTELELIDFDDSSISGEIDLTNNVNLTDVDFGGNDGITSIVLGEQRIIDFNAYGCSLTETSVNNILIALDENELENGEVTLNSGTNAAPTGDGITALDNLEEKGWNVQVNQAPGGSVSIAASTDFDISGDFTIEMFTNLSNTDSQYPRIYSFGTYPAANAISIEGDSLYFWANNSQAMNGTFVQQAGEWNHIAIMGSGSAMYMFVNGTQVATDSYSGTISSDALPLTIGYGNEANSYYNGLMSNFRWTNSAVYDTAGFTVPTTPLEDLTDTILLTFQGTNEGTLLLDNSGNGHDATGTGVTYSELNPFTGVSGSIQMGYA